MCMVAAGPMLIIFPFFQKYFCKRSYSRSGKKANSNLIKRWYKVKSEGSINMKKKVVSLIMSVALAFSSMHVMNIAAENVKAESNLTEATVTNLNISTGNYEFIDIASNGSTLVALTKTTDKTLGRLFYSTDNGATWQPCQNQPPNLAATISSNKNSQQQLVYWKANNIFVAHGAASTYTSEDGILWAENKNLHWSTNTMIDVSGNQLVFGGQDSANATADLTANQFKNNKYTIPNSSGFYAQVAVAKPAAEDGNISMFICNQYKAYDLSFQTTSPKYTWTMQNNNQGSITKNAPYDATYSQEAGQYLIVDGSEKLYAITDSKNIAKITVANGEKVVGVLLGRWELKGKAQEMIEAGADKVIVIEDAMLAEYVTETVHKGTDSSDQGI